MQENDKAETASVHPIVMHATDNTISCSGCGIWIEHDQYRYFDGVTEHLLCDACANKLGHMIRWRLCG